MTAHTVHVNCQVKNEDLLLEEVLPIWAGYPVDRFVFLDDNSTDDTKEVIKDLLPSGSVVFVAPPTANTHDFHEAQNRSRMLEYSRRHHADIVISLDADELLTETWVRNWDEVIDVSTRFALCPYQYNLAGDWEHYRNDPAYANNFRDFVFPMALTGRFDLTQDRYHTPRTPPIDADPLPTSGYGFIHLQSLNRRFYALKQLWYKVYEYKNYGKSPWEINAAYDPVVNGLNFEPVNFPPGLLPDNKIDPDVFDKIEQRRGYRDYVLEHGLPELFTFGQEYL